MAQACHTSASQRLIQIMPQVNAVPVVSNPALEEIGLQGQFNGDGQKVGARPVNLRVSGLGHFLESPGIPRKRLSQTSIRVPTSAGHDVGFKRERSRAARTISPCTMRFSSGARRRSATCKFAMTPSTFRAGVLGRKRNQRRRRRSINRRRLFMSVRPLARSASSRSASDLANQPRWRSRRAKATAQVSSCRAYSSLSASHC